MWSQKSPPDCIIPFLFPITKQHYSTNSKNKCNLKWSSILPDIGLVGKVGVPEQGYNVHNLEENIHISVVWIELLTEEKLSDSL